MGSTSTMSNKLANGIKQLDLNLFVVFDTIYREQNLTRASEVLCISQPAVSHALARLRERLNDPLFERRGKYMKPTAMAKAIAGDIRQGISHFELAVHQDSHFEPRTSERQFTMALPGILEAPLAKEMAKRMESLAPNIRLKSLRIKRSEIEQSLKAGMIDLAVDIHIPTSGQIDSVKSGQDQLIVLLRKQHPIMQTEEIEWDLQRYLDARHIFVSNRHYGLGAEDYALSKMNHSRNIVISCQHFYAASQVVLDTDLLLTIPKIYAQSLNQENNYAMLPFPAESEPLESYIYWQKNSGQDPGQSWFKEFLQSSLDSLREG